MKHIENLTRPLFFVVHIGILIFPNCDKSMFCLIGWTKSVSTPRRRVEEQQHDDNLKVERMIADEIMETVNRLQLPFILDQLTEGRGNCFPIAVIQQCQRPEINKQLKLVTKILVKIHKNGPKHRAFRYSVMNFIKSSEHPMIQRFRLQYEATDGVVNKETWSDYWKRMLKDGTWVDYWFVQATAWYLELDIWIIATSNTENSVVQKTLDHCMDPSSSHRK